MHMHVQLKLDELRGPPTLGSLWQETAEQSCVNIQSADMYLRFVPRQRPPVNVPAQTLLAYQASCVHAGPE